MPNIVACLEDTDDSHAVTMAMLVLKNLLKLLEGKTLSLCALAIAPKLRLLFDDVRLGERLVPLQRAPPFTPPTPAPCSAGGCFAPLPHGCAQQLCAVSHPLPAWTKPGLASQLQELVVAGWQQGC